MGTRNVGMDWTREMADAVTPSLRPYQETAVACLHENDRFALWMDMGLGKTAVVLSSLRPQDLPVLVVAPKRVAENVWPEERDLWRPDLSIAVAAGTPKQREEALRSGADIVVIGRDVLHTAVPHAGRFVSFVMDEASSFKERTSRRTKAAVAISQKTARAIELTGTPMPDGYLGLWAPLFILDKGERLGKKITQYRERYFTARWPLPNGVIPGYDIKPGAAKRIDKLLEDIVLSMDTEGRVDLPPVIYNEVLVPLEPKVRKQYKQMQDHLVTGLELLGEMASAANAAVLTSKLQQITAGFLYVDDADLRNGQYEWIHSSKIQAVQEIVEGTGSPVLVFYKYRAELEQMKKVFPQAREARETGVIQEWNRGEVPVLLAHPQSAGHGLNLQHGGHTIVWTSLTWSLEEWLQANKRLARSGQKHPVTIHILVTPGTVDPQIREVLEGRKLVQDAAMDAVRSPV